MAKKKWQKPEIQEIRNEVLKPDEAKHRRRREQQKASKQNARIGRQIKAREYAKIGVKNEGENPLN